MKISKIFGAFAAFSLVAASAFFMSCSNDDDSHEHTFATEWTSDATHHWHAATCGHTTEVKDKAEHTFGEWTVTTPPTEEADGKKEKECTVCGYKAEEAISKLDHTHTFATDYSSDATHHWHAATCGHTAEVKDKAEHNFGEWNITTQPTEEAEGAKERECSICYYKAEETIAKLEHTHTFATSYSSDDTHHWYAATCEHIAEVKDKAEHTFGEWISNNDATTWADGTKSRTCTVCSYKESETEEGTKLQEPDYTKCVVGDFILKNGTVLSKDSTPQNGTVAAVIFRAAANGKPALGVGIVHTETGWCIGSASGFDTNISDLVGDETSGYIDGSDSWDLLVDACADLKNKTGEEFEKAAENYPAFNYCRLYGTKNNLSGDLANGWYLPTVAELYTIYQNKTVVDASLSKAGGSQFSISNYWSCCQDPSYDNGARVLFFKNGNMYINYKYDDTNYVCSVRAFN